MSKHIHIHLGKRSAVKDRSVDAGRYVTKKDIRVPNDPVWGNWAGKIMQMGTVVYQEGSGFRPFFHKGTGRLDLGSDLVQPE